MFNIYSGKTKNAIDKSTFLMNNSHCEVTATMS